MFGDKEGGLVVDYVGIASALKQAMNDYTARDQKNYGDPDIGKAAYPKFLKEVAGMKEKNLAVELLKKLIAEQVSVYRRNNVVKSEKFSEIIQSVMNLYLNGMLTNEEVIEELLKPARDIAAASAEGEALGLNAEEPAFYDALTKPQAIKDFYKHEELIAIAKELMEFLRKNRTIVWQKRRSPVRGCGGW